MIDDRVAMRRSITEKLEAWAGALFATVLSFLFVVVVILLVSWRIGRRLSDGEALILLLLGVPLLDGRFLLAMWRGVWVGRGPIGPCVAATLNPIPVLLRPIASAWWLAHFLVALFVAVGVAKVTKCPQAVASVLMPILMFAFAVCANVYLALAVKALTGRDRAVGLFWRFRIFVDFVFTFLVQDIARHG